MDWKTILITTAVVIATMLVLKKTGLSAKLGLDSFEADPEI